MPTITTWIAPEVFTVINGVIVYFAYQNDDMDEGACKHHFTLDVMSDDHRFDVRKLDVPSKAMLVACPPFMCMTFEAWRNATSEQRDAIVKQWEVWQKHGEREAIMVVLKEAIELGLLVPEPSQSE